MILTIENLKKQYGDKVVLDIEKFEFEKGLKYAIIGANGSGKSTLLKILAKTDKQSNGNFEFEKDTAVGFMPQHSFGFSMSVLNNIMLAFPLKYKNIAKVKTLEILEKLMLLPLKKKNGAHLSGGETERLALGRLLSNQHDILLLDEPTASMDVQSAIVAEKVLLEYLKQNGATLIFATHSLKQAERIADIIIFFANGNLIEYGKTKTVLNFPTSSQLIEFLQKA
ncbi:MAG: ATP-binding cassette domain-containing protein [Clostridia bacterium]|nr:ATP-binding cassette domain-containing protein [Clostridia bacterium]